MWFFILYIFYHMSFAACSLLSLCREGSEPELAAVATGSHIDAIPYSGKYDGVVGVLGAMEAINTLKRFETVSGLKL